MPKLSEIAQMTTLIQKPDALAVTVTLFGLGTLLTAAMQALISY